MPSIPKSFTFLTNSVNTLTWTIEASGVPITNAAVSATLFYSRSRLQPNVIPGIQVPNFTGLSLAWDNVATNYTISFPFPADSAPQGGGYTLVVDAVDNTVQLGHWERPAVISEGGE